jgi:hypothetical protein
MRLEIDNGVEGKAYVDNTSEIHAIVARGHRRVMVRGTMLVDVAQFNALVNRTQQGLNLVITADALGTNGNFQIMLDIPTFQFIAYPIGVPGPQEIYVGFEGLAKWGPSNPTGYSAAQLPMQIALVNDVVAGY